MIHFRTYHIYNNCRTQHKYVLFWWNFVSKLYYIIYILSYFYLNYLNKIKLYHFHSNYSHFVLCCARIDLLFWPLVLTRFVLLSRSPPVNAILPAISEFNIRPVLNKRHSAPPSKFGICLPQHALPMKPVTEKIHSNRGIPRIHLPVVCWRHWCCPPIPSLQHRRAHLVITKRPNIALGWLLTFQSRSPSLPCTFRRFCFAIVAVSSDCTRPCRATRPEGDEQEVAGMTVPLN